MFKVNQIISRSAAPFAALALTTTAMAMQPVVTQIRPESDGTMTYLITLKIDPSERISGGQQAPDPDFFTIYNFKGLVPSSNMQPEGWKFSSDTQGPTPIRGGRRLVNVIDAPGIPNVTWSRTGAPLSGPQEISGFAVRTTVKETMTGQYASQASLSDSGMLKFETPAAGKESRVGGIVTPQLRAEPTEIPSR